MTAIDVLLIIIYGLVGILSFLVSVHALRSDKQEAKYGTALFWGLLGFIFMFGNWIPATAVGYMIVAMAILSATKQVRLGHFVTTTDEFKQKSAQALKSKLFLPALILAVLAFVIAQYTTLGALNAIGISGIAALAVMMIFSKASLKEATNESSRLISQMGPMAILPQVLAALGALFTIAGVGNVIATGVGSVIPEGNIWFGVIAYCVGMALFTAIMGNAFAAFSVITAGIGMPFVFALGGDPLVAGAIALTAGFCGTLMTPMGANFNMVPASLLELKNKYGVIKAQAPVAIIMLVIHIVLMRYMAF